MKYNGRFQDLTWASILKEITIGGAGGIGSWLIFFLSRIGHTLYVYDYDRIDETNFGGQLYPIKDVGRLKVESIQETVKNFSQADNIVDFGKFEEDSLVTPIVITCFDNMKARKEMFEQWAAIPEREVFIDGRMQAEYFECYLITPEREEYYRNQLFDDSEVEDLPCSAKATTHCGAMCGAMLTGLLNNYLTILAGDVADMPFKVSIHLPLMLVEVINEYEQIETPSI